MQAPLRSSGRRFSEYRRKLAEGREQRNSHNGDAIIPATSGPHDEKKKRHRSRPFLKLTRGILALLRGHRGALMLALMALSISTTLGLAPL